MDETVVVVVEEDGTNSNKDLAAILAAAEASVEAKTHDAAVISKDEDCPDTAVAASDTAVAVQLRTIRPGSNSSQQRIELLPAYPRANSNSRVLLLLSNVANVDRDACEQRSFCGGNGVCPYEFRQYSYVESIDSFMIDLYRDLFIEPSRLWKINHSIIDYNLTRLRKCMALYTKQTNEPALASLNELTLALEFFLQIDVDIFFMKTCNYRGSHPRSFRCKRNCDGEIETEGILCQAPPKASCRMAFCYKRDCFLCASQQLRSAATRRAESTDESLLKTGGVQFCSNQIHRFVNKYEAILNCHANCLTSNVIYALTCPCGQYDYIDSTSTSFHDQILKHRDESNRIIREFLIGPNNIDHMLKEATRSAHALANNNRLLYQHSPRCSLVLQRFLDQNPDYWCLVPMSWQDAKADDDAHRLLSRSSSSSSSSSSASTANAALYAVVRQVRPLPPESPTLAAKPLFFQAVMPGENNFRSHEECMWLTKGVPKPPPSSGYTFSRRQIDEQMNFFKLKKEARIKASNLIDCHKYTIIAVLPDDCSYELRRFIEALFITHAETKMNTIDRLTHQGPWPPSSMMTTTTTSFDHSNRGLWFEKLVRSCVHLSRT